MYNSSFSARSLMYVFNKNDYISFKLHDIDEVKQKLINAEFFADNIETNLQLRLAHAKQRSVFIPVNYESEIILRKLDRNIKFYSRLNTVSRSDIVLRLKEILSEGVEYNIARYDIKRFYDNIDINKMVEAALIAVSSSYETQRNIKKFLLQHKNKHGGGLPTGISLSATLSEVYLRDFDAAVRSLPWVRYYARYVDDIILITSPLITESEIEHDLMVALPSELQFNEKKGKREFKKLTLKKGEGQWEAVFDYLGYKFHVGYKKSGGNFIGSLAARNVHVDISDKKIKIRKSRFISIVHQYLRDGKYIDFKNRFRLLNSGYVYLDERRSRYKMAGLIYTYPHIDMPSENLKSLQKLYFSVMAGHKGALCGRLRLTHLSRSERRYFLGQSLENNFTSKAHVFLKTSEIARLVECWKHVD